MSALFAEAAERMAREIVKEVPRTGTPEERAENVVRSLNRLGFRCTTDRAPDGSIRITRSNCIFRHSAITHPFLLCDVFDKHLTEALLGQAGVDLLDSIGRGGMRCTHLIPLR